MIITAAARGKPVLHWPEDISATLDRLQRVAPLPTLRARDALARFFESLEHSVWPEIAWSFSRLTNTGVPIEFAWSSRDLAVRYTVEADAPEAADTQRLAIAAHRLQHDFGCLVNESLETWVSAQTCGPLKFGAWIGGRHTAQSDAFKLYIELPGVLPELPALRHPICRHYGMKWRMAGISASGECVELYAYAPDLDGQLLGVIEATVLGSDRRLLKAIISFSQHDELPNPSGISFAFDAQGVIRGVCWFTFAKALFSNDDATQAAILRWTRDAAVDNTFYSALISGQQNVRWRHGIIGMGLDATGKLWLQAGLRPS